MPVLICGSLAFDTITIFPGKFSQQILPEQVHILNVAFLVPKMRREFGGCAGNIAYTLKALGGDPLIIGALGHDGGSYINHLQQLNIDPSSIHIEAHDFTAQAFIITDEDNNQITAFHPGAMNQAHRAHIPIVQGGIALAIIAPDGRESMQLRARQLSQRNIPFVFDPGQGLPMFNGQELMEFMQLASWIAVNDYEGKMLCDRTSLSLSEISSLPQLQGLIVTLGAQGCDVWMGGKQTHVPGEVAKALVDPTGCGDAFRAGLLYGLDKGWDLVRCVKLGNSLGAVKIAHQGGQNHEIPTELQGLN
jgi:adenosine kinase